VKTLVKLALIASLSTSAIAGELNYNRTLVVADSLGAAASSWPQQLQAIDSSLNVQNNAQGGRKTGDVDLPRDVRCGGWFGGRDCVVLLALGSNDTEYTNLKIASGTRRLIDQAKLLGAVPIIVLPPVHKNSPDMERVRKYITRAAGQRNVRVIDLENVWDDSRLTDGVHPNASLSQDVAFYIYDELIRIKAELGVE